MRALLCELVEASVEVYLGRVSYAEVRSDFIFSLGTHLLWNRADIPIGRTIK